MPPTGKSKGLCRMAKLSAIAQRVRRRMVELDIRTIKELESKAGLPRDTIRHLLSGRTHSVRSSKIQGLADALKISVDELLHGDGGGNSSAVTVPVREMARLDSVVGRVRLEGQAGIVMGAEHGNPFLIVAVGDNMAPTICAGDIVLVDSDADHIEGDGIYLIIGKNNAMTFRRAQISTVSGVVTLANDNQKFLPESGLKPSDLRVAGRVVGCFRRL